MKAQGLTVVGASAGSGKTHRLTQEVLTAVTSGEVPLEGLVAVTYTKRAQVELDSRIRRALLTTGGPDRAARLPLANVGTVHAACLRLVRELALDAGLSPAVDVLIHDDQLIRTVLEDVVPVARQEELDALAQRMAILANGRGSVDWVTPIVHVLTLARHGRVRPEPLAAMGARSTQSLLALCPPPAREDLDAALKGALQESLTAIAASGCTTKLTKAVSSELAEVARKLARGPLDWPQWCKLGKLAPGKKARSAVEPVLTVAHRLLEHPRLQADLTRFTELVFEVAATAMAAYQRAKEERKVVDYVDMIDRALTLLEDPSVAADLRERLRMVVVDELQDSSPIQLALFLRLHALSGASRWVGDPKQCIFEYAGADPALMDAVLQWVTTSGGAADRLGRNYRTRPDLVAACNALFGAAFAMHGVPPAEVMVEPARDLPSALAPLPPLGVWYLGTTRKDDDALALAEGVRTLLASPADTPVLDRATRRVRPLQPGDVAVLVSTNAEAVALASALAVHRIPAALAREGLLTTPEGTALMAALGLLLDERATQERAVLEALLGFEGQEPSAWLSAWVEAEAARRNASKAAEDECGAGKDAQPPATQPSVASPTWARRLCEVRARRAVLSPAETVDAVLSALDLAALAARWPDARQRLANLDALRALTADYEAQCLDLAEGASVAGLLRFLRKLSDQIYQRGEMRASDAQAEARGTYAVTLLTYHRSKGLEWPVVVLGSLDRKTRRRPFDVVPECDAGTLDPDAPLDGRWIRYWPWPFGPSAKHDLGDRADASAEGRRVATRERRERARLLYVGFTRARDHLILAARPGKTGWLDELTDADHVPLVTLPEPLAAVPQVLIRSADGVGHAIPARVFMLEATDADETEEPPPRWFDRAEARGADLSYRVAPSAAEGAGLSLPTLAPGGMTTLHAPLLLQVAAEAAWSSVGNALHAFLAADAPGLEPGERRERAMRLLDAVGAGDASTTDGVLQAADAFRTWVEAAFPGAVWRREIPIEAALTTEEGERSIVGTIDLLLELPSGGCIVIDHKSDRVLSEGGWRARAGKHGPQLAAYALALQAAGHRVEGLFVHFMVGGAVVELES